MIHDSVKIHDNFSIEIKSIYENIYKKKKSKYDTITYLFVPNGLNINAQTYSKNKFYNDVKVYIRYNTPLYTLSEILKLETSPLNQLVSNVDKFLIGKTSKKLKTEFEANVKMFGAVLNNSLKHEFEQLKQTLKKSNNKFNVLFFEDLDTIIQRYRQLVSSLNSIKTKQNLKRIIKYGDEFISNSVNYYLINLHNYCLNRKIKKETINFIVKFISKEQKYRKTQDFDLVPKDDYFDETLLHKRSQLKKYIEGVLFLNRDIRKDGTLFEQTIFALAAGIAMVFSTGVAFYYQSVYGNFTLPFFIALVVGYMFKDRIKWLIGLLFIQKSDSLFYDYKVKIKDQKNNNIGYIKENFTYVPLNKLGPKVKKHRFSDAIESMDYGLDGEQIIQYKKKIVLNPKKFGKEILDNKLDGLADITRINFHRFIPQMDDPKKKYSLLKKGHIVTRTGNKIYHINVIQKLYTENGIFFKHYRLVMNRKGIKRIEYIKT